MANITVQIGGITCLDITNKSDYFVLFRNTQKFYIKIIDSIYLFNHLTSLDLILNKISCGRYHSTFEITESSNGDLVLIFVIINSMVTLKAATASIIHFIIKTKSFQTISFHSEALFLNFLTWIVCVLP